VAWASIPRRTSPVTTYLSHWRLCLSCAPPCFAAWRARGARRTAGGCGMLRRSLTTTATAAAPFPGVPSAALAPPGALPSALQGGVLPRATAPRQTLGWRRCCAERCSHGGNALLARSSLLTGKRRAARPAALFCAISPLAGMAARLARGGTVALPLRALLPSAQTPGRLARWAHSAYPASPPLRAVTAVLLLDRCLCGDAVHAAAVYATPCPGGGTGLRQTRAIEPAVYRRLFSAEGQHAARSRNGLERTARCACAGCWRALCAR